MKVLTGIYKKDSGTITYEGKEVEFKNTKEAQDAGVVIVHQELNMLGHLTVAQNLFIGREFMNGVKIDDKKMNEEAKKLFDKLNVDIDPTETMANLTVGKQQMCEIAKAVSFDAKVIVFDEPSAALTESEIEEMFKIIRDLKKKDLCQMANISTYTIGKMNRGDNITTDVLVRICGALDCSIEDIMEIIPNNSEN